MNPPSDIALAKVNTNDLDFSCPSLRKNWREYTCTAHYHKVLASVKKQGVKDPVLVQNFGEGLLVFVGHTRLMVCKTLSVAAIPAVILSYYGLSFSGGGKLQRIESLSGVQRFYTHYEVKTYFDAGWGPEGLWCVIPHRPQYYD